MVEGTAQMKLDGIWRDLEPEDGRVVVPRNVRHARPCGAPAYRGDPRRRLEEFLTESARAAREGLYNRRNMPTSLR